MEKYRASVNNKWANIKLAVAKNIRDYCDNTTIHGLKYIGSSNFLPSER